jgi:hypothetical protein
MHRSIGDTGHVCLLDGNTFVLPSQRGTSLCLSATGYYLVAQVVGKRRYEELRCFSVSVDILYPKFLISSCCSGISYLNGLPPSLFISNLAQRLAFLLAFTNVFSRIAKRYDCEDRDLLGNTQYRVNLWQIVEANPV